MRLGGGRCRHCINLSRSVYWQWFMCVRSGITVIYGVPFVKQVFRVKKLVGALMGRPKLELLASNSAHICHAIYIVTLILE